MEIALEALALSETFLVIGDPTGVALASVPSGDT
jgi:hypothetical protein